MGEAESRERRMQSVPCLHQLEIENMVPEQERAREPLFRRDINILEAELDREERKESLKAKQKLGEFKLKKARDLMKTIKENDQ
jgi:hypothetical protein